MCHEDPSSVSQTFKSNHAHTQRTKSEQNQWKSNQSLLHVPEHWKHIQTQIGVSLQWMWGGIRKLTICEFMTEITTNSRQRCVSEVHVSTQHSSQTLSEFDSVDTSNFTARSHATLRFAKSTERTEILNYRTTFAFPNVITFIFTAVCACPVIIQLEGL